jgi:hypothetical protein
MICPKCEQEDESVTRRRMNTQYVDEESNYITVCGDCYAEIEEYWAEMWEQYYEGRL